MPTVITTNNIYEQYDGLDWPGSIPQMSDYSTGPISPAFEVSQSITWSAEIDFQGAFEALTGALNFNYSETYEDSQSYTLNLDAGVRGRITYTGNYHWIRGNFSMTTGGDYIPPGGEFPGYTTPIVQVYDHVDTVVWFPIKGGVYRTDFALPALWTEIQFQGTLYLLPPGSYNATDSDGTVHFANDLGNSISVPQGFQVELFRDANLQGPSITLGPGEIPVFDSDWANQVTSVIVTGQER